MENKNMIAHEEDFYQLIEKLKMWVKTCLLFELKFPPRRNQKNNNKEN